MSKKKMATQDCTDKHCPTHGELVPRGMKFDGVIVSDKMQKSVVVEREFVHKVRKYERYTRKQTRVSAHNPECIKASYGDRVIIQECRPISKTKAFVIVQKV